MGILLVYDVTDERSFDSPFSSHPIFHPSPCHTPTNTPTLTHIDIRTWFSNVEQHATEGVNKILIGNKCDWEEKRVVSTERGQQLADELGIPFMEVSAKSNINVEKAFFNLAADIKKRIMDTTRAEERAGGAGNTVDPGRENGGGMGGKCC